MLTYTQNINPYEALSVPCKQTDRSTVGHMPIMQAFYQNS
jgi:hypothetical protein